jgi:hypothetical protein
VRPFRVAGCLITSFRQEAAEAPATYERRIRRFAMFSSHSSLVKEIFSICPAFHQAGGKPFVAGLLPPELPPDCLFHPGLGWDSPDRRGC